MRYFVTFEDAAGVGAIDAGPSHAFELVDALVRACRLLDEKKQNVAIRDERSNSIAGDDLLACCNGEKEITADLKAISV